MQNGKTQFGEPVKKILRFLFRDGKGTPGALPLAAGKVPGLSGKQMKAVGSLIACFPGRTVCRGVLVSAAHSGTAALVFFEENRLE